MEKKPYALWLADALETTARPGGLAQNSAAELRRLDAENKRLLSEIENLRDRLDDAQWQ